MMYKNANSGSHFILFRCASENFIMACYTVSLTSNETIYCKTIKSSTVNLYVTDAAKLAIFNNKPEPIKNALNQRSSYIANVINEHKRWESMPNHREPLTYSMVDHLFNITHIPIMNPQNDTLPASVIDWFILGMQTGMRKSEWYQDRYLLRKHNKLFQIGMAHHQHLHWTTLSSKAHVVNVLITLDTLLFQMKKLSNFVGTFQKNGNNGEILTYMANDTFPYRCPVRAALRIRERAIRLQVPPALPIAVFRNDNGFSQYIDDFHVIQIMQFLAKTVYNITDPDDLARFTCDSIKVGACVLLHETGKTPDFIKARLRWYSDAYQMYLRNTPKLAMLHHQAVNESDIPSIKFTRFFVAGGYIFLYSDFIPLFLFLVSVPHVVGASLGVFFHGVEIRQSCTT